MSASTHLQLGCLGGSVAPMKNSSSIGFPFRTTNTTLHCRCWNCVDDRVVHAKLRGEADLQNLLVYAILNRYIFLQSPEKSSPDLDSVTIPGVFYYPK